MVHHPAFYADLLKRKIERYGVNCWLLNTGWVGGAYGVGKRISIGHTRAILSAALSGKLDDVEFREDPVFGFGVPLTCEGVSDEVLDPASSWPSEEVYFDKYRQLASRFRENFKKFQDESGEEILAAGPK
jgi:phosphoenolpyruvate carboxykinase (ATP)